MPSWTIAYFLHNRTQKNFLLRTSYGVFRVKFIVYFNKVVLKGIIGYSDYSLAMVIFEYLKSNEIFIFLFKASHLTTLMDCLLVFHYVMDI